MSTRRVGSVAARAAGLAAIAVLQVYWFAQPVPLALKVLTAAFTALSIARPGAGLLTFATVAPLTTLLAGWLGGFGAGSQLLEQMMLGLGAGTLIGLGQPQQQTRIGGSALLVAGVALASTLSMLPADAAATVLPGIENNEWSFLALLTDRRRAAASSVWAPLFLAITVAECALFGWSTERAVRRSPGLAARVVALSLAGHAVAALVNVNVIVDRAVAIGNALQSFPHLFLTERLSLQTDVHAAGSVFVLAGVAGLGLLAGSLRRKIGVSLLLALIATGLWVTGSRVAIIIAVASGAAFAGWQVARRGRRALAVAVTAVFLILAGAWWATRAPSPRYSEAPRSISTRLVLWKAGLQMFVSAPAFGIGVGKFYGASADVIGPDAFRLTGYTRENAHNNFLQVLTEQGVVGLAAMLAWLWLVVSAGVRALRLHPDALGGSMLLAILATMATWLLGHPLLVPEFASVFWMYCGVMTGLVPVARERSVPWVFAAAATAVVLSSVPRAVVQRNAAYLEHAGSGLSLWHRDGEMRYREAGKTFTIYLPAADQHVAVPLSRLPGAPDPLVLDISLGGQVVSFVSLSGDEWQTEDIAVPRGWKRFERASISARGSGDWEPGIPLVRVGRPRSAAGVR